MNEIFGIQVCRRLFEAPKRKRPAASHSLDGGMLANLVPEVRLTGAKKAKSRKDSRRCDTSVLATMGRYNSPPRSNKEMKEMSSSVMAMDYSDPEKKDVAMSVFEMICLQETRNVTSGVHGPYHRQSAKRRRIPPHQVSRPVLFSSKAIDALSVLETVQPVQDQMTIGRTEIKGSKRRGKRERLLVSGEGMKPTVRIAESSVEVTEGSKKSEELCILKSSAEQEETKATKELRIDTKPKCYPTSPGKSEVQCSDEATETAKAILEHRTCQSASCNATLHRGEVRDDATSRSLSHEQVKVFEGDDLLGISEASMAESTSPAVDVSTIAEAAITLLRLSSSKSESEDEGTPNQLQSVAFERIAQDKGRRKKRKVHAMRGRSVSPPRVTEPMRRSNRAAAPTQRFIPVDTRRRKRLAGSRGVKPLKDKGSDDDVGVSNNSRAETSTREEAAEKEASQVAAMKSAKDRMKRTRQTVSRSPQGEHVYSPKNPEACATICRHQKTREGSINRTQTNADKSVTIKGNTGVGPPESNVIKVEAGGNDCLKTRKERKSETSADSPCKRRSFRLLSQGASFTPPHKIVVEDDFFDSIQRRRRAKPDADSEESRSERKQSGCVVKTTEQTKKPKETLSRHQKEKDATVGATSHSESKSDIKKIASNKAAICKQVAIRCGRNMDEPTLVDLDGWTWQQIASLRSAYANADPCSDQFWEDIANQIDGQSEDECRKKWFSLVNTPAAKKTQTQQTKRKHDGVAPKREVDEDDLFNSTPMRLQLLDDCADEKKHQVLDIDFGSPIVVDESYKGNQAAGYDDEAKVDVVAARLGYSKTYIKNLKRDISKGGKEKVRKKKIHPVRDTGPRGISSAIDCGDLEVKGTLSPGGTMRVRTIYWNGESEDDDELFDSDDE